MFGLENKIVEKFQMKGKLSVHIEIIMASFLTIELQLFNLYYSSKYISSPNFYMIWWIFFQQLSQLAATITWSCSKSQSFGFCAMVYKTLHCIDEPLWDISSSTYNSTEALLSFWMHNTSIMYCLFIMYFRYYNCNSWNDQMQRIYVIHCLMA